MNILLAISWLEKVILDEMMMMMMMMMMVVVPALY